MVASPGIVGNYVIERELGRGGMGIVYAATHRVLGKSAAIKVLLQETSSKTDQIDRFFNEARAAMAIDHPGIVKILDVGWAADGRAYIAMELLAGESLAVQLDRGPLPVRIAVERARQIAEVLDAAHTAGIIHRDLKPDNVMIVGGTIKLLDFGIAKLHGSLAGAVKTVSGAMFGTPAYMAPEQCEGSIDIDGRADLYSLGCLLFAMLTGRPPFDSGGAGGIIGAHLHVPPPPLRSRCASASPALEALVTCLLAKRRDDRFQTARAVIGALSAPDVTTLDGPGATADLPAARSALLGAHASAPQLPAAPPPPAPPPIDIRDRLTVDETESPYKHPQIFRTHVPAPASQPAAASKRWLVIGGIGAVVAIAIVIAVAAAGGSKSATRASGSDSGSAPADAGAIATNDRVDAAVSGTGETPSGTLGSNTGSSTLTGSATPPTGSATRPPTGSATRPPTGSARPPTGSATRPPTGGNTPPTGSNTGPTGSTAQPKSKDLASTDAHTRELITTHRRYVQQMCACTEFQCATKLSEERKAWLDGADPNRIDPDWALEMGTLSSQFAVCLQKAMSNKP